MTFNVAFGNADAHARNYSLLLHPDGRVTFAPLYDLVCTRLYPRLGHAATQHVDGQDDIDAIGPPELVTEAVSWGLPRAIASQTVDLTLARMARSLDQTARRTVARGGDLRGC